MPEYIIAVGSNIDPEMNLLAAFAIIKKIDKNAQSAPLLKTKAQGFENQDDFINSAFLLNSSLDPMAFKQALLQIEQDLKRVRTSNKNGPRTIDLDISVIDGKIVDPDYQKYDFVKHSVDFFGIELSDE